MTVRNQIDSYLSLLFDDQDVISLRGIRPDGEVELSEYKIGPRDAEKVVQDRLKDGLNLYVGCASRRDPNQPSDKENCHQARVLWVDLDGDQPAAVNSFIEKLRGEGGQPDCSVRRYGSPRVLAPG